ncbi:PREDICTED: secretoglobin family 1D member 2-like [Ceratotherium simum simum]|uniref:Secretoglobin family 1D member 2-like n=1 Tax=Ceratotherium simum simum TaxID=73337 RepID=A0ABM1D996_CERSS|nr:PREDICTED: secretoglobin family 1D member 2-like [Ceratotherium simum simum]
MRLSLSVLLVTLALCCYEANAVVCPAIVTDMVSSFFSYELTYKLQLLRFGAPREAVDARLEMKRCTDKISFRNRLLILKALAKILLKCGYKDLLNFLS